MAASDARPVPRKNAAFRFYFAIRKRDGSLLTDWTGADSEVSIDGAAFADVNPGEATQIGSTGVGYIDFAAGEMNGDCVVYKLTVSDTGTDPLVFVFYPEESGDYRVDGNAVADSILLRNVSNTEASAGEHTLTTAILALLEWSMSGTNLTIKRTDGTTTHYTKTLTTAASGDIVTGVN